MPDCLRPSMISHIRLESGRDRQTDRHRGAAVSLAGLFYFVCWLFGSTDDDDGDDDRAVIIYGTYLRQHWSRSVPSTDSVASVAGDRFGGPVAERGMRSGAPSRAQD